MTLPVEFWRIQLSSVCESHSAAFGCAHGCLTSISDAIESSCATAATMSGAISGSDGAVPNTGVFDAKVSRRPSLRMKTLSPVL